MEMVTVAESHDRSYERRFGVTFTISFILSMMVAPFFLADTFPDEAHGLVLVLLFLGGIFSAAPMFLESLLIAAIVFFPVCSKASSIIGSRAAFVFGATLAAFVGATLALLVHVEFSPFQIMFAPEGWWFGSKAGLVAATITFFVAAMQLVVPKSHE